MEYITSLILGAVIIVLGIINLTGNISTIHYYHRKRVSAEDRLPFAKTVGVGTIIIGVSLIIMGILSFLSEALSNGVYLYVGYAILAVGVALGSIISFYAMIKYNKGIF